MATAVHETRVFLEKKKQEWGINGFNSFEMSLLVSRQEKKFKIRKAIQFVVLR